MQRQFRTTLNKATTTNACAVLTESAHKKVQATHRPTKRPCKRIPTSYTPESNEMLDCFSPAAGINQYEDKYEPSINPGLLSRAHCWAFVRQTHWVNLAIFGG